eukprot:CAMPEP_0202442274 /NCGR_PEP_ID=MMETSP1360-20130828/1732_1 /ASSEMBLY_ACC=CAM_ASM_000848 /TAXON_ID=515479 /ORGANISM="Licmophora paradoxa, Strain CCMP2313" /LENGTH=529 /DNA_ID=CAMNT_0049057595 /DNA_START=242 /DNA_END=1831 /DNA_ORIENTATION=-
MNLYQFFTVLSLTVLQHANALTDDEIASFQAKQSDSFPSRNAFVRLTRNTTDDTIIVESSGVPDHEIFDGVDHPWYVNLPGDCKFVASKFTHKVKVPNTPLEHSSGLPGCVPEYAGVATNGVAIYFGVWDSRSVKQYVDTLFGNGGQPPNECLDQCGAHPNPRGMYHYHGFTSLDNSVEAKPCWINQTVSTDGDNEPSGIVGVAFDGYAIYGPFDEDGTELFSADLDECHGKIDSDGIYRYRVTRDFPYILGCMKGEVIDEQVLPTIAYGSEVDTCVPGFGEELEVYTACCKYTRAKVETVISGYEQDELSQVQYGSCTGTDISSDCRCVDNNRALQEHLGLDGGTVSCRNYYMCLVDDDCPGNTATAFDELIETGSQYQTCVSIAENDGHQSERACVQTMCSDGSTPSCSDGSTPSNPTSIMVTPNSIDYNDWVQPMRCNDGSAATCSVSTLSPSASSASVSTLSPSASSVSTSSPSASTPSISTLSTPIPSVSTTTPTSTSAVGGTLLAPVCMVSFLFTFLHLSNII